MSTTEIFNADTVKGTIEGIGSEFNSLSELIQNINTKVTTALSSPDNAMYGDASKKVLATWDENCSTLNEFIKIYDNWSSMAVAIGNEYGNLQEGTAIVQDADKSSFQTIANANKSSWLKTADAKDIYKESLSNEVDENTKNSIKQAKETLRTSYQTQYAEMETKKAARKEELAKRAKYSEYLNPGNLSGSNLEFINSIKDGAIDSYNEYGVLPSLTLAQAILETGWGNSKIGNNIFGIKAGSGWTGKVINCKTTEEINGQNVTINDDFRDYDSISDSVKDHAKLLSTDLYQPVIAANNYKDACYAVKQCGYATASNYAECLISLIEQYGLDQWDPK